MNQAVIASQRGFTLIELITVIILLGILAAVAVPRMPDVDLFERQFDVRQVVSSLSRARAHAINSQCYVAVVFEDREMAVWIEDSCSSNSGTALRTLNTTLPSVNAAVSGGVITDSRIIFAPSGAAYTALSRTNLDVSNGGDLTDFAAQASPGALELAHESGRTITVYDTTGYALWQ